MNWLARGDWIINAATDGVKLEVSNLLAYPSYLSLQDAESGVRADWQLEPDGVCEEEAVQNTQTPLKTVIHL